MNKSRIEYAGYTLSSETLNDDIFKSSIIIRFKYENTLGFFSVPLEKGRWAGKFATTRDNCHAKCLDVIGWYNDNKLIPNEEEEEHLLIRKLQIGF